MYMLQNRPKIKSGVSIILKYFIACVLIASSYSLRAINQARLVTFAIGNYSLIIQDSSFVMQNSSFKYKVHLFRTRSKYIRPLFL